MSKKSKFHSLEPVKKSNKQRTYWKLKEIVPDGPKYSTDTKIEAMSLWLTTGDWHKLSIKMNVPRTTLITWAKTPWWEESLQVIQHYKKSVIDAKLSGVLEKALDELDDRLVNGDEVITYTGDRVSKKIGGKELMIIAGMAADKREKMREAPASIEEAEEFKDKMSRLAEEFIKLAKTQRKNSNSKIIDIPLEDITDGEIIEDETTYASQQEDDDSNEEDIWEEEGGDDLLHDGDEEIPLYFEKI